MKCDNDLSTHKYAFNSLRDYYDNYLEIESDRSVKDVLRLCFISHDPDLYINEDAEVFNTQVFPNNETKSQDNLEFLVRQLFLKERFQDGSLLIEFAYKISAPFLGLR